MSEYVVMPKNDYASICNATRAKTGGTELLKSGEIASEIEKIETGKKVYVAPKSGILYEANTKYDTVSAPQITYQMFANASELETFFSNSAGLLGAQESFNGCTKLRKVILPKCTGMWLGNTHCFGNNPALEKVTLGSIGTPVVRMDAGSFKTPAIILELYVNAETIADIPTVITNFVPANWNENATIIYRNSTTGEVITA
ncbi:MAG: hypothetical protein J1E85_10105 [Ruminococcus sp.]|nr:hypothetical protein [Ruminococcus sp.]